MQYEPLLKLAIYPTVVFFLLSLVSVALTVHYWILGDWIVPKDITVTTQTFNTRLGRYDTDETVVYFTQRETDATISSGVLCLTAAVIGLIAWSTLRKPNMDSQFAAGKRRFYILAVVVMTLGGAITALVSLVLHFTEKGDNEFSCASERLMMSGTMNTNQFCTREMAACNFQQKYLKGNDRNNAVIACNEAVTVKWLQVILIINALVVCGIFAVQARIRRASRAGRLADEPKPQ